MPYPQPGGESAKIGDRYESIWTVRCLIDVIRGRARWITVESLDENESEGAEFTICRGDGSEEFHSVKRQRLGKGGWTIAELTRSKKTKSGKTEEGIGPQLFRKLQVNPHSQVKFVTTDSGNDALALFSAVRVANDIFTFRKRLSSNKRIEENFTKKILSFFDGDFEECFDVLKRFEYLVQDQFPLCESVEDQISDYLDHTECPIDAKAVRELLAGFVFDNLGNRHERRDFSQFLNSHNIFEHDFNRDSPLFERISSLNDRYLSEFQYINGALIERSETKAIFDEIENPAVKQIILSGSPGAGKSSVLGELANTLLQNEITFLAIRLDTVPDVYTSKALGKEFDLANKSPVSVLDGISKGDRSVLIIDQVDAISSASGRNQKFAPVFRELLEESDRHPNMKVVLSCRSFDLTNDPLLEKLANESTSKLIEVICLTIDVLESELAKAEVKIYSFDEKQINLLRNPFNLFLFLAGDYKNNPAFDGVHVLFDRFRDAKVSPVTS